MVAPLRPTRTRVFPAYLRGKGRNSRENSKGVFFVIPRTVALRDAIQRRSAAQHRGEIVDRSLHYYFLSAVRREVLIVGKYFSGLVTSIVLFTFTTITAMFRRSMKSRLDR